MKMHSSGPDHDKNQTANRTLTGYSECPGDLNTLFLKHSWSLPVNFATLVCIH